MFANVVAGDLDLHAYALVASGGVALAAPDVRWCFYFVFFCIFFQRQLRVVFFQFFVLLAETAGLFSSNTRLHDVGEER